MNREIKFRGKRVDNNEWIEGDLIQEENICYIRSKNKVNEKWDGRLNTTVIAVIQETVGQYTGLKDVSKKEICEGDILKIINRFWDTIETKQVFAELIYSSELCKFILRTRHYLDINEFYDYEVTELEEKEIIGTIHDNTELLK